MSNTFYKIVIAAVPALVYLYFVIRVILCQAYMELQKRNAVENDKDSLLMTFTIYEETVKSRRHALYYCLFIWSMVAVLFICKI